MCTRALRVKWEPPASLISSIEMVVFVAASTTLNFRPSHLSGPEVLSQVNMLRLGEYIRPGPDKQDSRAIEIESLQIFLINGEVMYEQMESIFLLIFIVDKILTKLQFSKLLRVFIIEVSN